MLIGRRSTIQADAVLRCGSARMPEVMRKFSCKSCGNEIRTSRLVLGWPSRIRCTSCSTVHAFRCSAALGTIYMLCIAASIFGVKAYADRFAIKQGDTYATGPLQAFLEVIGPLIALAIVGSVYVWVLGRFFELRRHDP